MSFSIANIIKGIFDTCDRGSEGAFAFGRYERMGALRSHEGRKGGIDRFA